ncbi:MAG TPA: aminoacetone oxidase family FAD-binding enzyme [Planctomycetota bacterium]
MGTGAAHELVIVGAGAAGLWAAARAAELGRRVLLLEKTPRTGTKVLASGGTRCNLTTTLGPDEAARLFGARGERFLRPAFRALPPRAVRERFHGLDVPTLEAPLEKVFPASQRAKDVRDALERWAVGAGVELRRDTPVHGLERRGEVWRVALADGAALEAPHLFLCPGGKSYARTGTTGDGYAWLAALGLPLVEPVPALVPLVSAAPWVHALAGIALQDVTVRLRGPEREELGTRARPVVFTHQGLSGPGAMDLSEPVAREEERARRERRAARPHQLVLDLLPERAREALRDELLALAGAEGAPQLAGALASRLALPRRLVERALAQAGLAAELRVNALARAGRHGLVEALKGLAVPVTGTRGFELAEVTAGGLALEALDPRTLRVRGLPGLWAFGELIDVQGPIGGLNFQAAFATAELAARSASA